MISIDTFLLNDAADAAHMWGLGDLPEVEISMMRMMRICRLVENRFLMESFWSLRRLEKGKNGTLRIS
jgi:hypothetical protein